MSSFIVCVQGVLFVCLTTFSEMCQNGFDIETNLKVSAHIVHPTHILLIQFGEIAQLQKRLWLFCHSVSQVTFTENNFTSLKKHHKANMKSWWGGGVFPLENFQQKKLKELKILYFFHEKPSNFFFISFLQNLRKILNLF